MLGAMDTPPKPLKRTQLSISAVGLALMGLFFAMEPDWIRWPGYAFLVAALFPTWQLIRTFLRKPDA